jgi:hypothetical protein
VNEKDDKFFDYLERKDKKRESGFSLGAMLGQILKVPEPEAPKKEKPKGKPHRYKMIRYKNGKKVQE